MQLRREVEGALREAEVQFSVCGAAIPAGTTGDLLVVGKLRAGVGGRGTEHCGGGVVL